MTSWVKSGGTSTFSPLELPYPTSAMADESRGVPQWAKERARELAPSWKERKLTSTNMMSIIRMGQIEVERMMIENPPERTLDVFEMFCGKGETSDLVRNAGGASRKFDRTRGQIGRVQLEISTRVTSD